MTLSLLSPIDESLRLRPLKDYASETYLSTSDPKARVLASVYALLDNLETQDCDYTQIQVNRGFIEESITNIDKLISEQLDAILHHPEFKELESLWAGVSNLLDSTQDRDNVVIEIADVSKSLLEADFAEAEEVSLSYLYKQVYTKEYDTPGGEPYSAILSNYSFNHKARDIALLTQLSQIAAAAHCPFLANVDVSFFGKASIQDVCRISDFETHFEKAEYIAWNQFRTQSDTRYLGLCFPKVLGRLPYSPDNYRADFIYFEKVLGVSSLAYQSCVFAFAKNMISSFKEYGWTVNIRGPEAGGLVQNLPLLFQQDDLHYQTIIPTEMIISETEELALANSGFIPFCYYKNTNKACFFSANSLQKPPVYQQASANANAKVNARLPYIFLASRLGHYLKVLQRESIGSTKDHITLQKELNGWLQGLITKMNSPSDEVIATHPLRDGQIIVEPNPENPGYFKVSMSVVPHFQVEGMDIQLSLVSKLPNGEHKGES